VHDAGSASFSSDDDPRRAVVPADGQAGFRPGLHAADEVPYVDASGAQQGRGLGRAGARAADDDDQMFVGHGTSGQAPERNMGCIRRVPSLGLAGAERSANVRSYLDTTRKNDVRAIDALMRLFAGDPWMPPAPA
jgi:hypothetical protein